mmetsp:Transcript_20709/g.38011  ORF Transcript_20709/g.38011 Transcript_20709/m.38011 type:complete len:307 (+) Transcript_20709:266-1186(+)
MCDSRTLLLQREQPSTLTPSDKVQQSQSCTIMQTESSINPKNRIRRRRKLKSALFFALTISALVFCPTTTHAFSTGNRSGLSQRKHDWIERSVQYYSTVLRKNAGTTQSQHKTQMDSIPSISEVSLLANKENPIIAHHDKDFVELANKHYYARSLIKMGKWDFAETIYRRIIDELTSDTSEEDCDHTKLAVSTLLLALHMQRTGNIKATRAVFINFFRRVALVKEEDGEVHKCSCSAKVLQAYALFEMKNGHSAKSLEIIQRAIKMDEQLSPVLEWKQFRDAAAGRVYVPTVSFRKRQKSKDGLSP